jgi:hypothetical protein
MSDAATVLQLKAQHDAATGDDRSRLAGMLQSARMQILNQMANARLNEIVAEQRRLEAEVDEVDEALVETMRSLARDFPYDEDE